MGRRSVTNPDEADMRAADCLARANEAKEKGKMERAENLYALADGWMALSNRLRGNGDGGDE